MQKPVTFGIVNVLRIYFDKTLPRHLRVLIQVFEV